MHTTSILKSAKKPKSITAQEIVDTLEEVALQVEQIKTLSIDKISKQLKAKSKQSVEKEAILEKLDNVSLFVDIVRQSFVPEELDLWAKEMQNDAVKNLEDMIRKGTLIRAENLIEYLGWTRQALSKARKAKRIFSVDIKGETYYPAFFTEPKYEKRQLEAVSKALGDLPGASKLQFMVTPKGSLKSLTPLEALAKGKVVEVKIAAEGFVAR